MSKTKSPLRIGDAVMTSYPDLHGGCTWRTVILHVYPFRDCGSGWLAVGAAEEPCAHCGAIGHPQTPELDAAWFTKNEAT